MKMYKNMFQSFSKYNIQLFVVFRAYFGLTLLGFCISWTVPVEMILRNEETTPLVEPINDITASWIGSVISIGSMIGPYLGHVISRKYGRIPSMVSGSCVASIAFILQSFFTVNVAVIYVQRLLQGIAIMCITPNCYAYIGEVASVEIRGSLLGLTSIFTSLGSIVLITTAPLLSFEDIGYLGLAISIISTIIYWSMQESPLWLSLSGKQAASDEVMKHLKREDIIASEKNDTKSSWVELFRSKSNRKAFSILVPILMLQSASGSTSLTYFTTSIFEKANLNIASDKATIISSVIGLFVVLISSCIVDNAGRRFLLLVSTFGAFVTMAILGAYFYLDSVQYSMIDKMRWLPVVCVILFSLFFNLGYGPIPYILLGELFDKNARTSGPAFALSPGTIIGFVITTAFGYMITSIGIHFTFWVHSLINAVAFVFTLVFVPETKGKTLEEIHEMLKR